MPTPHPGNSEWVRRRVDAVVGIYNITPEGAALFHSLDVRQMRGEPGFFGSYGFHGWAGVGEARPIPVMHELSHSYWGGFPVEGRPDLSWDRPQGGGLPPALKQYHADVLVFMAQPPDRFELLRQRLRNLPGLDAENLEPLLHNLEADMVYNTGGDLALAPPVLRKYWSRALNMGPYGNWIEATSWFRTLSAEERATAGQYLGFEHLDTRGYMTFPQTMDGAQPFTRAAPALVREEKQRLFDFAHQFDLLMGGPQKEENFSFWRSYLRDKVRLHRKYPDYMESLELTRAKSLATALDRVSEVAGLPTADQAPRLRELLRRDPYVVNFIPALDDRTLVDLFVMDPVMPQGATLRATASFVQRLRSFEKVVNEVLAEASSDPRMGASAMAAFLDETGYGQKEDLRLFFELMRGRDRTATNRVLLATEPKIVQELLKVVPANVRFILQPEELLEKLEVTKDAELGSLVGGVELLVAETSGNFLIDEPFLHAMFRVLADRSTSQPIELFDALDSRRFPLYEFIRLEPGAAAAVLRSDFGATMQLIGTSDPVVAPPQRVVHRLVHAVPELAARTIIWFDESGEEGLALRSLGFCSYDLHWGAFAGEPGISLENDARLLETLLREKGEEWLADRMARTFALHNRPETGPPGEFGSHFADTWFTSADYIEDDASKETILRIVERASGITRPPPPVRGPKSGTFPRRGR